MFVIYSRYSFGSSFVSSSVIVPYSFICTVLSSMSACMNSTGMPNVVTFWCSMASMRHIRKRDSVATVGALVSSLVRYLLYFLSFAHSLPFIFPHLFCFKNVKYQSATFLNLLLFCRRFFCSITIISCSCFRSLRTAATLGSQNNFSALDTCYWVSTLVTSGLRITLSCWLGPQWTVE